MDELQSNISKTIFHTNLNFVIGRIKHRPSKYCKSPYVADVELINEQGEIVEEVIAHAPSLGCCGYVDRGQLVVLTKNKIDKSNKKVCSYTIHLALRNEKERIYYIGVHPKIAEQIVFECLTKNYIPGLKNLCKIEREKKYLNSRFDFCGIDENGIDFILEVKNVPCGDYVDMLPKNKSKISTAHNDFRHWAYDSKIAYFPDGYRKNIEDTVSPRAVKHLNELTEIKKTSHKRCIMIYVIQRPDCLYFQPSNVDPCYQYAFKNAVENGIEIIPIQILWKKNGNCYFQKVMKYKY